MAQLCFLVVAGFLLTNKVWSPQYSLWLVPLAVLALPHRRILLAWMTIDALVWVPRMMYYLGVSEQGAARAVVHRRRRAARPRGARAVRADPAADLPAVRGSGAVRRSSTIRPAVSSTRHRQAAVVVPRVAASETGATGAFARSGITIRRGS